MKYILLSVRPEWCCKLMNGDKGTEVRRGTALYNAITRLIKEQGKAPCLIYCTKDKRELRLFDKEVREQFKIKCAKVYSPEQQKYYTVLIGRKSVPCNGKVVAEFEAQPDRIFNVRYGADEDEFAREHRYVSSLLGCEDLEKSSCLEYDQLLKYLGREWDDGYIGTAIHVKRGSMKTEGFPKNLSDYGVERAPQSWQYIEADEDRDPPHKR